VGNEKYEVKENGIIDKETGEHIENEVLDKAISAVELLENGGVIHSKKQVDKFKEVNKRSDIQREVLNEFGNFLFLKVKNEMVSFVEKKIPEQYIPRIFMMSTFADKDGVLIDDGRYLRQKDLIKILNISERTFITMAKELDRKKIMHKISGKYFKLSKTYFVRGQLPRVQNKARYIKVFTNTVRELYSNLNISKITHYKAFIMAVHLLPLLERNTCIPKHINGDKVTVRDLLSMAGINDEKYWRQINYVKHLKLNNGEQLIKFVTGSFDKESALNASMVINPRVFYSGDSENINEIDYDFKNILNN